MVEKECEYDCIHVQLGGLFDWHIIKVLLRLFKFGPIKVIYWSLIMYFLQWGTRVSEMDMTPSVLKRHSEASRNDIHMDRSL